jgi:pyrroloquinoline quinone biosynthesis protein B
MLRCDPYLVDKSVKEKKMKKMERRNFFKALLGGAAGMGFIHPSRKTRIFPEVQLNTPDEAGVLVQVLGTAQDGGLPQIGCYCKNCLRARENTRYSRLISSLALLDLQEKKYFLLDATPDIRPQSGMILDRLKVEKRGKKNAPHAVLLTHAHIGHYTGLMFYGYEAMSTQRLPVLCTSRMKRFLSENGPWSQLVRLKNIFLHTLLPGKEFSLTPRISLTPFLEETERVDVALLDGTFYSSEELPGRDISKIGHPTIKTSLKTLGSVAKKGKTQIYFTHLNHTNLALDPEGDARKEITDRGFRLASDGKEFFL